MTSMNAQTRIIVATAAALAAIDIAVRLLLPTGVNGNVVSAREIRLVDGLGRTKTLLKVDESGEPGLLMYDRNGTERLQLDTFQHVPSLILNDENENRRVYFGMSEQTGDGLYQTSDAQGNWFGQEGVRSMILQRGEIADPTMSRLDQELPEPAERANSFSVEIR